MTPAPNVDSTIPPTASPEVGFISLSHLNPSTELNPIPTRGIDLKYFRKYVRTLEEGGYDYTLLPYGASSADSFVVASAVGQLTERIKPIVALRPNTTFPTVGAQKLATLDQLTEGRAVVHIISGGNDAEQARQGDYLPKDKRYARTSEYVDLLRRSWTEPAAFSHDGEFYKFDDLGPGFAPYESSIPISIGGQSDEAFQVGGEKADIFSFWGEPLDDLRGEIDRVHSIAREAGRTTLPRIWVTFRPIIAQTDQLAWQKAHEYVAKVADLHGKVKHRYGSGTPQNVGSQRALAFASKSELYDRALWTKTAAATNGAGASTALVGSPETVAAAILDYIDRGASLVSIRGYDTLADAVDYGRYVLPLVREELAHRKATGQRGTLQAQHLGNYSPRYAEVRDGHRMSLEYTIPETAADQVEFVSITGYNQASELNRAAAGNGFDLPFFRTYIAALEDAGFDYTLNGYSSSTADSFIVASATGQLTERLKPIVALRPNHTFPLVAAQKLATLDQLTQGRAVVHLISGGVDAEQRKQGDYEPKARRYARTAEFIDLLRRAWTEKEPFSFESEFYKFDDFGPGFGTYSGEPVPISIGGQSDEAFEVGAAKADWFTFNAGESVEQVRTDIDRVHGIAARAGRQDPRIWVTFRPIVASTDAQAWEKAFDYAAKAGQSAEAFRSLFLGRTKIAGPESAGGKRQQEYAAANEGYDRASWSGIVRATGGAGGASTALVGSYETVAAAIVDQIDAGASIVSIRGFDVLNDVVDYGKHLLPLVRQEIAHRKATGQRGDLQKHSSGFGNPDYLAAHDEAAYAAEHAHASESIGATA